MAFDGGTGAGTRGGLAITMASTQRDDRDSAFTHLPPGTGHVTARQVVLSATALWLCYFVLVSIRWAVVGPPDSDMAIWIELLWRRALVTLAGIAVTVLAWPVLRRFDDLRMGLRVGVALAIMLPGAVLLAVINQQAFAPLEAHWDQQDKAEAARGDAQRNMGGNVLIDMAPPTPVMPPAPPAPPAPPSPGSSQPAPAASPAVPATPIQPFEVRHRADGSTEITGPGVHIVTKEPAPDAKPAKAATETQDNGFWQELTDIALGRYFLLIAWAALYLALGNAEQRRAAEWREAEYRRAAKAAELRSLRYQVNPHFLFNTLNSLSALVMVGRAEEAERMIQTISSFYRHSLAADPTSDVPLADEIALQRHYLAIEGVRFPDRLRVEFEVPEDLEHACVPGMILQPLVENSIKYAVSATTRPVTISIRAQAVADLLVLTVADDGPGTAVVGGGTGIGLDNVRNRLAARFGAEGRIESGPLPAGGYATVLTLPIISNFC
ncbi:histidine kinase [Novosphingobium sp.]|uniref:histidine kinase n=1 Tax=Novosphingobium sp. TaxID=1874826 RepID=UPI002FDEF738